MKIGFRVCNLILFQSGLPPHAHVHINDMPSLYQVCYPSDIEVPLHTINTTGSPNVCFQQDCNGECTVARIDDVYGSGISVFPNPTHNILIIESGISDLGNIEITSLNGQLIRNEEMEGASYQLDLSSLGSGVYFITIRSNDFVTTRKIIKLE